jgi:hypothetical protein
MSPQLLHTCDMHTRRVHFKQICVNLMVTRCFSQKFTWNRTKFYRIEYRVQCFIRRITWAFLHLIKYDLSL